MKTDDFDALAFKYFAAGLTPDEDAVFQTMLRERPELRRRFLQESIRVATIHEWAVEQRAAQPRAIRPRPRFRIAAVAAAAAVILAAIATAVLMKPASAPPVVVAPPVDPVRPRIPAPPPAEKPPEAPVVRPVAPPVPPLVVEPPRPKPKPADAPSEVPKDPPAPPPPPERKPAPPKDPARTVVMVAVLEEVRGSAVVSSERGDLKARTDLSIPAGATVRTTGPDAVAVLVFPDKTRVALGADTELRVVRGDGGKLLTLVGGVAALDVTPQPREQPLQVQTPQATATVLGTAFTLRADGPRLRLEVDEGKVRMENPQGRNVVVAKDQAVDAVAGAEFSVKRIPPPDLVSDLVGHWRFDEPGGDTAHDVSPLRHAATVDGASRVRGKSGLALRFDGVDDFVRLPRSPVLDGLQEGDYTVTAWCQPGDVPRGGRFILLGKVGYHLGLVYDDEARFEMWHYLNGGPEGGQAHARTAPGMASGVFTHLAGVVSRSKGLTQIYVNGRLEGVTRWAPGGAPRDYGGRGWTIGMAREAGIAYGPAAAVIDEVRLYRRALSPRDIAAIAGTPMGAASRVR